MTNLAVNEARSKSAAVRVVLGASLGSGSQFAWATVPSTLADDGEVLEAIVLDAGSSLPGAVTSRTPVGGLSVRLDERNQHDPARDERLILVLAASARPVTQTMRRELERFCTLTYEARGKNVHVAGWESAAYASDTLIRARADFSRASEPRTLV